MKKLLFLCVAFLFVCSICVEAEESEKDIRVLVVHGGHGFQKEPFFKMFDNLPGVKYKEVDMMKNPDVLKPGLEKEYDVIVRYDMFKKAFSKEQQQNFINLLNKGIGLICLHHAIGAHQDWPEYVNIVGAKYFRNDKGEMFKGKHYARCTYAHDQDVDIKVVNKNHPITKGVKDFQIHDETYKGYVVLSEVEMLLTTDHPKGSSQVAWTTKYGKSSVFYLQLGHDSKAWGHPSYSRLLANAIYWAKD